MISKDVIEKIQTETDIVELVSEFISLERVGKNYRGLCPFHDDSNPSFSVSPEKNIAMCMTCKEGGRPIKFYSSIKNISNRQAIIELGKRLGIEIKDQKTTNQKDYSKYFKIMEDATLFYKNYLINSDYGKEAFNYLKLRKINEETINHFKLGYAPNSKDELYNFLRSKNYNTTDLIELGLVKRSNDGSYYDFFRNRLIFPITNESGSIVAFSGRALNKNDDPKYINSPETIIFKKNNTLYNLNEARMDIRKEKSIIIFEGFFDSISAYQAGIKNSIASMGTSFSNNQTSIIKEVANKVIVAFDGDNAGLNASINISKDLLKQNLDVNVLKLPSNYDPDDYIRKNGKEAFNKLINKSLDAYEFGFNYYLNNTNLNSSTEIQTLINNIKELLKYANPTIAAIYRRKLSEKLKIDERDINIKTKDVPKYDKVEPERKRLSSRYEQAEIRLLILMLRSKEWFLKIQSEINFTDSSNINLSTLRSRLQGYYDTYDDFDLSEYKSLLKEDELAFFEKKIQKDKYWQDQTHLDENEIKKYIKLLKDTSLIRRRDHLKNLIIEKLNSNQNYELEHKEFIEINAKLKNIKEDQ